MACKLHAYHVTPGGRTYVHPLWVLIGWPWLYGPYSPLPRIP